MTKVNLFRALIGMIIAEFAFLVAGPAIAVQASDDDTPDLIEARACSDAALSGTYGFTFDGEILRSDVTRVAEFAGVGVETFDGHGSISSGRIIGTNNGQPFMRTFTGTYSINADCTGTKTISINGQLSHYALVIVAHGREIKTAETDPGTLPAFTQVLQ